MSKRTDSPRRSEKKSRQVERTIRDWEKRFPGTWILLEVTEESNGEPLRARLITTAADPEDFQQAWKLHRQKGVLTMVTYGPPLKPGPAVVASAT